MSKEAEKAKHMIREMAVDMDDAEYTNFMRELSEWSSYQAECADMGWRGEEPTE